MIAGFGRMLGKVCVRPQLDPIEQVHKVEELVETIGRTTR